MNRINIEIIKQRINFEKMPDGTNVYDGLDFDARKEKNANMREQSQMIQSFIDECDFWELLKHYKEVK